MIGQLFQLIATFGGAVGGFRVGHAIVELRAREGFTDILFMAIGAATGAVCGGATGYALGGALRDDLNKS